MRRNGFRKAMQLLNRVQLLTYFFSVLIILWKETTELSHQLSLVIVVNYTCHWKSPPTEGQI